MINYSKDSLYEEFGECNSRCRKCKHGLVLDDMHPSCNYICNEGSRRPCPAGRNCTVFEEDPRKVRNLCKMKKM